MENTNTTPNSTEQNQNQAQGTAIDYEKIQQMLDGTLQAKEKTALNAYFKQQGLSEDEAATAIADFKAKREASKPDFGKLTKDLETANEAVKSVRIQNAALRLCSDIGVEIGTMDYILKLADLKGTTKDDGTVDTEKLKAALEKVVTDVPAFKAGKPAAGFKKVGAEKGESSAADKTAINEQRKRFGLKPIE